jgi:SPP1 gp7 family putative phage head morphogenesis protein
MGLIENIGKGVKRLFEGSTSGLPGGNVQPAQMVQLNPQQEGSQLSTGQTVFLPRLLTTDGASPRYDGPPMEVFGVEGTQKFGGFYAEEYLPILQGRNGVQIFDEMFRSDSQVYTATMRTFNKIKGAKFYIKPPDKSEAAKKRAEKLNYCMFKSPVKVWHDNLNDILSFLIYSFSVLEPSFRQENHKKYGNVWCVNSYGWRSQKTIWQWYTYKDKIHAIRQISWGDDFKYVDIPGQAYIGISRPDGAKEQVPWSEVIVFTHLRFGNNLEGISPLRPMYRPFLIKDKMHKINIVGAENNARGIRAYGVDEDFLGTDKDKEIDKINREAVKSNAPMIKFGKNKYSFNYYKTDYQAQPLLDSIRMLDADISKTTQTESSEMGMTNAGGNRSLGESKETSHDESIKNYAEYICQKLNPLVKFLEICNDGEQDEYCEIGVEGIDAKPSKEDAEKLKVLAEIYPDIFQQPEMKQYVCDHFDLPAIDVDKITEDVADGQGEEDIDKGAAQEGREHAKDLQAALDAARAGKKVDVNALLKKIAAVHIKEDPEAYKGCEHVRFGGPGSGRYPAGGSSDKPSIDKVKSYYDKIKSYINEKYQQTKDMILPSLEKGVNAIVSGNYDLSKFSFVGNINDQTVREFARIVAGLTHGTHFSESIIKFLSEFIASRALSQYENKVNFAEINKDFNNLDAKYVAEIRRSVKEYIMPAYKKAVVSALQGSRNKHADLQGVEFGKKTKVNSIIKDLMLDAVKLGRAQAINEVSYKRAHYIQFAEKGDVPAGTYSWIKANAEYATDTLYGDLAKKAGGTALKSIDSGRSDEQVAYDIGEEIDDWLDKDVNLGGGIVVNKSYNEGRWSAFAQASEDIQGFVYSAILDSSTCDLCAELDGKTFETDDPDSDEYNPPIHAQCRCIIVPITIDESAPDKWDGLDTDITPELAEMKTLSEVI